MFDASHHRPHHPNQDVPDDWEPGSLPVEPDEGPIPAVIPDDPEHDRTIDPEARFVDSDRAVAQGSSSRRAIVTCGPCACARAPRACSARAVGTGR
jgi:hypothetical protein